MSVRRAHDVTNFSAAEATFMLGIGLSVVIGVKMPADQIPQQHR
jgi:hypothetical protein